MGKGKAWETVIPQKAGEFIVFYTTRLEVPGGWLYRVVFDGHVNLAFVPEEPGRDVIQTEDWITGPNV